MGLKGIRKHTGRSWGKWVGWLVIDIAVAVLRSSGAGGLQDSPTIFQVGIFAEPANAGPIQVPNSNQTMITQLGVDDIICPGRNLSTAYYPHLTLLVPQGASGYGVSGRCLYQNPVQLRQPNGGGNSVTSFSTMVRVTTWQFVDSTIGYSGTIQGLAFIITNDNTTQDAGEGGGYLGWLNSTTNGQTSGHNFAVELDFFQDPEFDDPVGIHLGIDVNSLKSTKTGYFTGLVSLNDTETPSLILWIDYDGTGQTLSVYVTNDLTGLTKPTEPVIFTTIDLDDVLSQETMFVGFSTSLSNAVYNPPDPSATDFYYRGITIDAWTFNSNGPAPDILRNSQGTPQRYADWEQKQKKKKIVLAVSIAAPSAVLFLALMYIISVLYNRNSRLNALAKKYQIEELEHLDQGPQNFKYKALNTATKGFSSSELLGTGGFGSVYKGRLWPPNVPKQSDIAVKRISATSQQGAREFLAEIKVIGQVQHRNLVRLLGWCHEKGELLLVYDYMPHGSLDQHLFKNKDDISGEPVLTWARRLKIVSGVASALAYLHEEWEQRVIHRDIKSSNVMLDANFNARLGDFGLARLSEHGQAALSTALAGTHGYLAPELGHTLKATEKTDVYSFGTLVLEVATGRKPFLPLKDWRIPEKVLLVDYVWDLFNDDNLLAAADTRLESAYDPGEMVTMLKIGLLCCHPDPDERPNMREVLNIWKGSSPFPPLPHAKPVPVFLSNYRKQDGPGGFESDADDTRLTRETITMEIYDHSFPPGDHSSVLDSAGDTPHIVSKVNVGHSIAPRDLELLQGWRGSTSGPTLFSRHAQWKSSALPM